jgi:hypothetical protein
VYLLIGILALMTAFGQGGETTDQKGVLNRVAAQPFGEVALTVIGIGLLAYALWRLLCAFANAEGEPSDAKGWAKRGGYFVSALVYGGLGWSAFKVVRGSGSSGNQTESLTARAISTPGGEWLVILAGIALIVAGIYQFRDALRSAFMKRLRSNQMTAAQRQWAERAGKMGYMARGIVFVITGVAFLFAGMDSNPGEAKGIERVLDTLAQVPIVLAFVALGLALYGAYCFVEARYRALRT